MLEVELKLAVEGPFSPTLPAGRTGVSGMDELQPLDLRATYYDTPDLRLARSGITLRHRTGDEDGSGWTVKLPAHPDGIVDREEVHIDGPARPIPQGARDLVAAFVRSAPLAPVARLRTQRRRWLLLGPDGQELAELVDDRVSVLQRGRVVERFREVEIESRGSDRAALERIAAAISANGAATVVSTPKLVRALGERAIAAPDFTAPDRLSPALPAREAVRAAIARGIARIVTNDPRTRLGEVEPLHQMRVGTRRLRSDLKTFGPLVDPEWADPLREELRWLGRALGAVRDLDVMEERLAADAGDRGGELHPLFEMLAARRSIARDELLAAIRSPRYVELLERLAAAARDPVLTEAATQPAGDVLPQLVASSCRKLRKAGRALEESSPDEDYHRVRVRAKRVRYASEAVAPALGGKRAKGARRLAKRAAALQDVLGEMQDAVVAEETIADFAARHPRAGALNLAAGRLLEREARARDRSRERFPEAWQRLDRGKLVKWIDA